MRPDNPTNPQIQVSPAASLARSRAALGDHGQNVTRMISALQDAAFRIEQGAVQLSAADESGDGMMYRSAVHQLAGAMGRMTALIAGLRTQMGAFRDQAAGMTDVASKMIGDTAGRPAKAPAKAPENPPAGAAK